MDSKNINLNRQHNVLKVKTFSEINHFVKCENLCSAMYFTMTS